MHQQLGCTQNRHDPGTFHIYDSDRVRHATYPQTSQKNEAKKIVAKNSSLGEKKNKVKPILQRKKEIVNFVKL